MDGHPVVKEPTETSMAAGSKGKLPAADGMWAGTKHTGTRSDSREAKKAAAGESSSSRKGSSNHSATRDTTQERRRSQLITQRFKTLQQMVPGCHKSNKASTLDKTIKYIKSLLQQIQAMDTSPAPPAAVYPFGMPMPPTVAAVAPGTVIPAAGMVPMVQFGAILPYPYYHAVMMPPAAAALYPPAPQFASAPAPDATGDHAQRSVSTGQQQHENKKDKRRRL